MAITITDLQLKAHWDFINDDITEEQYNIIIKYLEEAEQWIK